MRHSILVAALSATLLAPMPATARGQDVPASPLALADPQPATLSGAVQFDVASHVAGRAYRIQVYRPMLPPPPGGYPVVYVTDGNGLFGTAATQMMLRQFGELRPAIIVGVGYPVQDVLQPLVLRNHDLTPETPRENIPPELLNSPLARGATFGGAEAFYRFLVEELRPALAAAYPVNADDQTLFGDSLGGLFALHVLFRHPESFRSFAITSPSIWWNNGAVLTDEAAFRTRVASGGTAPRVLLMVGGMEQRESAGDTAGNAVDQGPAARGRMVDNVRGLSQRLSSVRGAAGYRVRFDLFPGETHGSVVPSAISRALGFALGPEE